MTTAQKTTASSIEHLECSLDLTYNWGYEETRKDLRDLYKKAKRSQWNSDDQIPWSIDVDIEAPNMPEPLHPLYGSEIYAKLTFTPEVTSKYLQLFEGGAYKR